jgi:hypothetical protein
METVYKGKEEEFKTHCQAVTMFYDLFLCFINCVPRLMVIRERNDAKNVLSIRSVRRITITKHRTV